MGKFFDEQTVKRDPARVLAELFTEYKDVPTGPVSKFVSPSGLGCQVGIAFKLQGAPVTPQKESFQSRCMADAGEDRHLRIQEFLSKTEYWVDVEKYIKAKGLNLKVLRHDGYEVLLYSPEYQARFKLDGMLFIDGHYYVLEIKTERQSDNNTRTAANAKHLLQGKAYTLMLDTDRIMWVYEGRDYFEQKPIVQLITKEEKNEVAKWIKDAIQYKDEPEKLVKNEKSCVYCAFKNYCKMYFKEREKRIKLYGDK